MPTTTRAPIILALPTADPYARGYTDDDFPRVQELAPGVYSYEQLHAAGLTLEQAIEQADFGDLDTWSLRASQAPRAIGRVYMELNGELPPK